ncbi:nose resistant to fluoxetine protein 6 [Nasonia vitripennis]|uniref:Nose resistant-to-fluoxetine protein N-terminal domain-containing protein n=1 Tax=Nasonia vitripennis TaxID=7425 RepID=A0A7M7LM99_NASVI|nr:nose resistant to fluoxetine protein 6 [Nasonia vitripennis]
MSIFILVLLTLGSARSSAPNYGEVADKQFLRERLSVLQPEAIFREFFEDKGDWQLNEGCARDLRVFQQDLERRRSWALRMLDASSTVSSGVLKGNFIELGSFDECVEIHEVKDDGTGGRHCMYTAGLSKPQEDDFPVHPSMSICLPTSCDEDDVMALVHGKIQRNETTRRELKVLSTSCTSIEPRLTDTAFWISLAFYVLCIGFVTLCTLCDLVNRWFGVEQENAGTLSRFSALKALSKILSTRTQEDEIRPLHGMRVLSIAWVVLVHEYFLHVFSSTVNIIDVSSWLGTWMALVPLIGTYAVDTFFVMSGFLMTYNFFKKRQKNEESFNVLYHYIHRYLRLTLPIAALVASMFLILVYPLSGALYEWMESVFFTGCRDKWWSVLTYTQNFVDPSNRCLQHLWFMAVDMQLFLISPLILYSLYKVPKIGLTFLTCLFFGSIASNAAIVGVNRYAATYLDHTANIQRVLKMFDEIYQMPYTRAGPWLIGIALGYRITRGLDKPSKACIFTGWLLAILAFAFCIVGTKSLLDLNYEYNLTWEVIFAALSRPLWGLAVCWIIYACHHGYAGPISTFLSWKAFVPLSKLSYCTYLVHLLFPFARFSTARTKSYFSDYVILNNYVGDIVLSVVTAFFLSIVFEIPMQVLDSLLFKKKK